jgi:hypothetical protein
MLHLLHLIKKWLDAPVEETDDRGRKQRTTRNRDQGKGTPQGAPISPLLSNLYRRRFVLGWKALGHEQRLDAHIVNYADDFVICCRRNAQEAAAVMAGMMSKLKLTVNQAKTHVCQLPQETFDFLGYTFGRCFSPRTGRGYIGTTPSRKRVARICAAIGRVTERSRTQQDAEQVVTQPDDWRLGQLLLPRSCQRSLSRRGRTCAQSAASMALQEAQDARTGQIPLSRCVPASNAGPDPAQQADGKLPVGRHMKSSPRAGCGKSARPVR